jgi:hypothetical protein
LFLVTAYASVVNVKGKSVQNLINKYRKQHLLAPVKWEARLAKKAGSCQGAAHVSFPVNGLKPKSGDAVNALTRGFKAAKKAWDCEKSSCKGGGCGSILQALSSGAKKVGCALVGCPAVPGGNETFTVKCNFDKKQGGKRPFPKAGCKGFGPAWFDPDISKKSHTNARKGVGRGPLKWDNKIVAVAQKYANRCDYKHSGNGKYGENIGYQGLGTAAAAVKKIHKLFVNEKSYCGGHYSQMIDNRSKKYGCAVTACPRSKKIRGTTWRGPWFFVVCNYYPPGNMGGYHCP